MSGPIRPIGSATGPDRVAPVQLPRISDSEREQRRREAEERRRREAAKARPAADSGTSGDERPRLDVRV